MRSRELFTAPLDTWAPDDCNWIMREKTPQEKKQLSLQKDRRNVYGEAPHAVRKNIPLPDYRPALRRVTCRMRPRFYFTSPSNSRCYALT